MFPTRAHDALRYYPAPTTSTTTFPPWAHAQFGKLLTPIQDPHKQSFDYVLCLVCCASLCCWLWLWLCVVVCVVVVWRVWCGVVWHAENVHVVPVHTGTFLNVHTEAFWMDTRRTGGSSPVLLAKFAHVGSSLGPRGPPKKRKNLNHLNFENRSRKTCSRFLQSFALPDEAVELQLS